LWSLAAAQAVRAGGVLDGPEVLAALDRLVDQPFDANAARGCPAPDRITNRMVG
jgi:hypothetical protein